MKFLLDTNFLLVPGQFRVDILSELDHEHRRVIFEILGGQQTIMTTTDKHFLPADIFKNAEVIELR